MTTHAGAAAGARLGTSRASAAALLAILLLAILLFALALPAGTSRAESLLERGTYLMQSIVACGNCHTPQGPEGPLPGMELAGGLKMEDPAFTAYGANLTPDVETGIGGWSDEEIITAIREGRRPGVLWPLGHQPRLQHHADEPRRLERCRPQEGDHHRRAARRQPPAAADAGRLLPQHRARRSRRPGRLPAQLAGEVAGARGCYSAA
jgi:mono/diheme cytochrome c family protein